MRSKLITIKFILKSFYPLIAKPTEEMTQLHKLLWVFSIKSKRHKACGMLLVYPEISLVHLHATINLMHVPEEMLTESFYIDAVQLNFVVISRIPTAHKTVAICNDVEFNWSVSWFPPPSHSPEFYDMWKVLIVKHKDAYGYIREPTTDELTQLYKLIWGV